MSYSLNEKCGACIKIVHCSDYSIVRGAIDTIHAVGSQRGHLGSGTITLDCKNYEAVDANAGTAA